jgi:hypothetical protein
MIFSCRILLALLVQDSSHFGFEEPRGTRMVLKVLGVQDIFTCSMTWIGAPADVVRIVLCSDY